MDMKLKDLKFPYISKPYESRENKLRTMWKKNALRMFDHERLRQTRLDLVTKRFWEANKSTIYLNPTIPPRAYRADVT